jgi:hypothetical protein
MADKKITDLTAITSLGLTDLFTVVDGIGGTPANKKITVANAFTNATLGGSVDWSGGNVIYVPLTGSIADAITAATAGDTLQLAAGTYTITSGLTANKKLHIRGMGEGITTITSSTNDIADILLLGTEDGAMVSNLTIQYTASAALTTNLIRSTVNATLKDVELLSTAIQSGARYISGVKLMVGKTINAYRVRFNGSGSFDANLMFWHQGAGGVINAYDCYGVSSNGQQAEDGSIVAFTGNSTATINLYGGEYKSSASKTGGVVHCTSGAINVYEGTVINGSGAAAFDVKRLAGTLTLYAGTNLVNNKTSGTITYAGTVVSAISRSGQFRLNALNTAPAAADSTGTLGEIRIDADHIYVCTATDTWKRVAIATWE